VDIQPQSETPTTSELTYPGGLGLHFSGEPSHIHIPRPSRLAQLKPACAGPLRDDTRAAA
jgi:hypothetical protein